MYIINKEMWENKQKIITLITNTQNVCFKDWPSITVKNSQNLPLFCAWHVCLIIIMCDLWLLDCQILSSAYKISTFMLSFSFLLTLTLPGPSAGVSGSLDSYCSLKPVCSGMGEVVPACTSPTLLPPSPRTVLSLSCFKVSQCINCHDWHCKS